MFFFDFLKGFPCPIVSDKNRKSVYGEIGHTIMSLLCDTRNFQYTIPQIDGLHIHMEGPNTKIMVGSNDFYY
jgi:MAD, mothers against decapentaplegic interacting protein